MKTTTKYFALSLLLLLLSSCGNNRSKEAQAILSQADSAYQAKDYHRAMTLVRKVDSIAITDTTIRRKALEIGRQARWSIINLQIDSIHSSFAQLLPDIERLEKRFGRMQDIEDGTTLKMILPALAPYRNQSRTYLRIATDTLGNVDLTSVYAGIRPIKHAAIRLSDPATGQSVASTIIPYEQGLNYRYASGGRQYELVSYPPLNAQQIGALVTSASEANRPLTVSYLSAENKPTGISYTINGGVLRDLASTFSLADLYRKRTNGRALLASAMKEKAYLSDKIKH